MRRILLALGIVLVAGAAGVYVFVVRPLVVPAEGTPPAEEALVTPDVVLLTGVNVKQAAFLERWFLGVPVTPVAQATSARAPLDRTLLDHLRAVGVDPRRDLDYGLYALYRTDAAELRHAVVLVGHFNAAGIDDYLARDLRSVPRVVGGRRSHEVAMMSPTDCKPATTWMVTADRSWVLIADPASHAVIVPRLTVPANGAPDPLAWWRSLARSDVVSLGLWGVRDAEQAVAHPFQKGMAKAFSTEAAPFAHFYFGLGIRTVPPEGRLRLVLDADDAGVAAQKLAAWRQALAESKKQWAQTIPTVAALYDSFALRSQDARSTVEFTVDRALAKNLQGVANELLGAMLGGFGLHRPAAQAEQRTERIDSNPLVFVPVTSAPALGAYNPAAQFAEDVDEIQGAFGLRLAEVRLGSTPEAGLELVVEGFAGAIPNITDETGRARLFVDSVKSSAGQELLRSEPCGRQRNDEPGSFTTSTPGWLKATKTVRLIPGVDPHQLKSVSGHVELRLPTRVEAVTLTRGQVGMKVEKGGATFALTSLMGGSVGYQITGPRDKILHFRALNAAGQPLASSGGFSSDFLLGEGVAGQKEYAGVVERVEVIFAAEEQPVRLPFALTDLTLAGKPRPTARDGTPPFEPYGYQALRRDRPRLPTSARLATLAVVPLDPFELSLDKAAAYFGTMLEFTFRSPVVRNFEKAFTVGQLRLNRIELRDGTVLEPPSDDTQARPGAIRPVWDTPIKFGTTPKDGVLATTLRLFLDTKLKPEDIKAVRGVVTVQFPRTLRTLRLDDLSPGQHAELDDLTVTVTARGRKGLTFLANKDGNRLVYARLTSADGQAVASFGPNITVLPEGAWRFELSPLSKAVGADLILAGQIDRKEYPFALVPKE